MSHQGGYAGLLHELQGGALPAPQQTGTGGYAALLHEAQAGQQPLAQPAYAQAPSSDYLLTGTPAPGENRPNVNQPYMPPQPAPRSVAGEFGAAVFRGAETMLASPRALAFNQPVSELVTPGFEPSPAPAGAGLIRRGAHTTAQVAGGLVPAIGAGVVTAGAATPFIAPMLGTGLAATAASGVAGGVPIATQMAADMSERTGGDPAAVAASFGQNAALGAIPPLAVLNKLPGVRNVVGKAVEKFGAGPVMKYLAEVTGDAALAGGTNVGQAYVDEAIASRAGAAPREVDPVAEFLGGAGAVGALRLAGDVQRLRGRNRPDRPIAQEGQGGTQEPTPNIEQIDAEITKNLRDMELGRRAQNDQAARNEEMAIRESIFARMADPSFDPTSQLGQLREQVKSDFGLSGNRADRIISAVRARAAIERASKAWQTGAEDSGSTRTTNQNEALRRMEQSITDADLPAGAPETPERRIVANRTAQTVDPRIVQQIIDEYSAARAGPMTQAEGSAGPYRYTGPAGERLNIPTPADYPRALGADEAFAQKYELDPTFGTESLSLEEATWAARTLNNESPRYQHAIVQASADGERWVLARKRRPPGSARPEPTLYNQTNPASRESGAQPTDTAPPGLGDGGVLGGADPAQAGTDSGDPARLGQSTEPDFSSMTYAQVRAEAKRRGIPAKGSKADLVRAIQEPTPDVPAQADTPTPRKEAPNEEGQRQGQGRQEGLLNAPETAPTTENAPAPSVRGAEGVDSSANLSTFERVMLEQEIRRLRRTIPDDTLAVLHGERQSTVGEWTADQLLDPSTPGSAKLRQYMEMRQALEGQSPPQQKPAAPSEAPSGAVSATTQAQRPSEGAGGVARSELDRLELVRKWGDRWQYRTRPGGPWYYSNSEAGAVEGASAGYQSTPESERLTRQQRDEKANAEWYDDVHARYKHLSIAQVQAIRDQAAGVRGVGPDAEFTGNGGRRSGAALSNQGARDAAETARTLDRYIKERTSKEAGSPPQPPEPPAQVPPRIEAQAQKPDDSVVAGGVAQAGKGKFPPAIKRPVMPDFTSQAPEVQDPAAMVSKSGRKLEPYPDKPATTEAMTRIRLRQADEWLIREAIKEAESIGDDFNATGFRAEYSKDGKIPKGGLPQASRDAANLYLFGREQTRFERPGKAEASPKSPSESTLPPKHIQHSINQILKADQTISAGKIDKKAYESAWATIRTHAPRLGIEVPDVGTYFYADRYREGVGKVVVQIGQKFGEFPTQELRDRRDASIAESERIRRKEPRPEPKAEAPAVEAEPPTVSEIQALRKKIEDAQKRFDRRSGAMVPPPIRAEVQGKINADRQKLTEMEKAYRAYWDKHTQAWIDNAGRPKVETPATTTPKASEYAKIDGEKTIDLAKRIGVEKFLYERDIADNTAVGLFKQAIKEIPDELNVDDVLVMAKNIARMDKRPAVDGASMAEAITYRSIEGARKYAREMDTLAQENSAKGRKFQLADDGGSMAGQRARKIIGDPPYKAEPPPTPQVIRTEAAAPAPAKETPSADNAPTTIGKYHVYRDNQDRWHAGWIDQSGAQQGRIVKTREEAVALAESWKKKDADDAKAEQERYATTRNPIGLSEIDGITKRFERGDMTAAAWQNTYKRVLDSEKEIKAELNYRKLPELKKMTGPFFRGTKKDAVDAVYNRILNDFNIEDSLSFSPFDDPMGRKALHKAVMGITDERIAKYIEDKKAKRAARDKALTNPETYTEFLTFIQRKGEKALTPEQRAKWDSMRAEQTQRGREQQKEAAARVDRVDTGEIGFEVVEGKHTKTGATLHIVKLTGRVPSDTFKELAQAARKLGGNWAANSKWGPSPDGFNFKTREDAEAFAKVKDQSVSRAGQVQEARAESEQGAAQRLRTLADSMDERADETLGRDRLTNTARRARIADGVEGQARSEKQMAETLRNIADAIEAGNAKHLRGIRQRTHVEALQSVLRRAVWDRNQDMANRLGKRVESFEGRKPEAADADLAKYPWPDVYATVVLKQAQDLAKETGAGARYVQWLQRVLGTGEYTKIDSHDGIDRLLELPDAWTKTRDGKMLAERLSDISQNARRLKAANIQTIEELRAAIREYVGMRGGEVKADPIKEAERALIDKPFDGADFFPTPPELARRVAMEADIKPGMTVLEPSAGKGDLMDAVREVEPGASIVGIERLGEVAEIAKLKGHTIERGDFLETQPRQFDRIVMNPPFSNRLDAEHVQRAYNDFLAPGGRLVAIVSEGPFFASDAKSKAFREFIESTGAVVEKLEPGQFSKENKAFRETGVNVRMVTIDKPERLPLPEAKAAEAPPVNDRLDVVDPNDPDSIIAEIQGKVPQAYYGKASPDDAPWVTRKYQEAGTALVPGVRLGEAEDVGRVYHMMMEGVVSLDDYTRMVSELRASGKAPKTGADAPQTPPERPADAPKTPPKAPTGIDAETYRNVVKVVDDHRSAETHFKNTSRHADAVATLEKNRADVDRVIEDVRKAIEHLPESDPKTLDLPSGLAPTWKQRSIERDNLLDSMRESFRGIEKDIAEQSDLYGQKAKRLGHESPTVAKIRAGLDDLHKRKTRMAEEIREAQQEARKYRSARMYAEGDPVQRAVAAINLAKEGRVEGYALEQARVLAAFEHVMRKVAPEDAPPEAIKAAAESATQQHLQGTSRTMLESIDGRLENTIKAHLRKDIPAQATFGNKDGLTYQEIRALELGIERAGTIEEARALVKTAQELDAQRKAEWEVFSKTQAEAEAKAEQERRANSLVIDEPNVKVWWYGEDQSAKAKAIKEIQSITNKPAYTRTRAAGDPTTRKWPVWKGKTEFKSKADMLKELATFTAEKPTRDFDIEQVHIDQDGGRAMAMNGPWLVGVLGGKGEYGAPTQLRAPDVQWMVDEVFDPARRVATVNVLDTARHLKRAKLMTSEERPAAFVVKNKDGTLGFATRSPGEGHAEINVKDGGEVIGMINPEYMLNALLWAQQNGAVEVHIGQKWTTDNGKKVNRISIDGTNGSTTDRRGPFALLQGLKEQGDASDAISNAKSITDTRPEDARPAPKGKPEQSSPSPQSLGIVPPGTRELWAAIDRAEQIVDRLGEGARITQRAAAFIFGKATTYARLLGPEGKDIARSMERIQKDTTQNTNTDVQAIKKVIAGLSREEIQIVAKIANGRGNWAETRPDLVPYVEKLRPHFDRVMLEARRVGIMRGKGPKKVILEGSGAYVPEVPNAEGRKFIEEIRDPNQSDKQSAAVAAWADQLVADGFVNTPEEAIQRLVDYRDRLRRGLQPYLESFRIPLPEHMVNWDIRETVPPVLERSWQTVEAVREWNSDPANALGNDGSATLDLLTAKLERIRKSKGNAPADAIQAWADYSFGKKAPNPAASAFFGAWSNIETMTRLGGSLLSAATNYTQQFVNAARLSPWAVARAIKDYPPFLHPFMKSAVEAREVAERAGGVSDVSALTPLEGQHAGYKLARAALYPFRRVEVTNQVRTSLAAAHQAVDDIDRLIRMEGNSPLSGLRKAFESLGSLSGVDTTGGLKRRAAAMLDITPEQLAAKVKRHERLTPEEIADVMHRFSRDTQFLMGVATEPAWFRQSPIGRLVFKFKTWGARQLGLIYRDVVKEARYGNFAPLVRFTVATVVLGEMVQALRDWVKETENSATMYVAGGGRDTGEIAGRVLRSMAGGGAFGMLSDLTYGLGSFAFGPAGSTLGNVAEAASGAKDAILNKEGEGLGAVGDRFLRNQIPAYTQADRLFDKTVAAASGDLAELKRQTTLRLWRQRAMDFAQSKQERTVGQKVAGRIDDAIYGRYRVAGEANENTRPFEYAARAIDRGDVDEAADYLRIVLKNTPPGEMDSKVRAIESSLRIRAPLGRVAEKDYTKFLSTFTPALRQEAIKADSRWRADYSKAIGRAMSKRGGKPE